MSFIIEHLFAHSGLPGTCTKNMIAVTKIFRFEAAHAIYGYQGTCAGVHGHSYELHVTVRSAAKDLLDAPGFIIDFKELKAIVSEAIIGKLDHSLLLSRRYLEMHGETRALNNIVVFEAEPSAENLILYISKKLVAEFPQHILLSGLKLFETKDSYAEWKNEYTGNKFSCSL